MDLEIPLLNLLKNLFEVNDMALFWAFEMSHDDMEAPKAMMSQFHIQNEILRWHEILELLTKMAVEGNSGQSFKSKVFSGNALTPKDEFDDVGVDLLFLKQYNLKSSTLSVFCKNLKEFKLCIFLFIVFSSDKIMLCFAELMWEICIFFSKVL